MGKSHQITSKETLIERRSKGMCNGIIGERIRLARAHFRALQVASGLATVPSRRNSASAQDTWSVSTERPQ
jgi:hypothetical protein